MAMGVLGYKLGMTRVFSDDGVSTPVTVIEVEPNRVTQIKTKNIDGYDAVQVTVGNKKANKIIKPLAGHYAKAGVGGGKRLCEFRLTDGGMDETTTTGVKLNDLIKIGAEVTVDIFAEGQMI